MAKRVSKKKKSSLKLSTFYLQVYKTVSKIPLGEVRSYKWVAERVGRPKAARAVGQALRHNPWPILIPCHRVVGSNGKIGGYSQGIRKKLFLLNLERQIKKLMV